MTLRLRPHHFFCALGYRGKGYSDAFTANMDRLVADGLLNGGDDTLIEVTGITDDLCTPCPKRRGDKCTSQFSILALDARHARVLGLAPGDQLSWAEAKTRMAAQPEGIHQTICMGCQWLEYGLCESAHSELINGA